MSVGVIEIDGLRGHPFMKERTGYLDSFLLKSIRGPFDIPFRNREGEVLRVPLALIFLKDNHPGISARP